MAIEIKKVQINSPAARAGVLAGDLLQKIDGNPVTDVLDYRFYITERRLALTLLRGGSELVIALNKGEYEDPGLEFDNFLMDGQRHCTNSCIFCFVDQMPRGYRDTLYFKDDDSRMSFFFGSYITLTNLTEAEVERIIRMRISPINVSVHTTNPELRTRMMGNRFAGDVLRYLARFAGAGTLLNTQLVLCPGINDGPELNRSLSDLTALGPAVQSIACVPVGLTKHREGLAELRCYTQAEALEVVRQVEQCGNALLAQGRGRTVFPADEFYLLAGLPLPDYDYYEGFPQLENGVGMLRLLIDEFEEGLEDVCALGTAPPASEVAIATGRAAAPFISELAAAVGQCFPQCSVRVHAIGNTFLGDTATVAGLVSGRDLIAQLGDARLPGVLCLPTTMLRHEQDLFLDDMSLEEVQQALGVRVELVPVDGGALLRAMLGQFG